MKTPTRTTHRKTDRYGARHLASAGNLLIQKAQTALLAVRLRANLLLFSRAACVLLVSLTAFLAFGQNQREYTFENGQLVGVKEDHSCALAPASAEIEGMGASGSVVTGSLGVSCSGNRAWTAASDHPWITVTGGGSGSGNGTVSFRVELNQGAARVGTITAAGRMFTIRQKALTCRQGCSLRMQQCASQVPSGMTPCQAGCMQLTTSPGCAANPSMCAAAVQACAAQCPAQTSICSAVYNQCVTDCG